MAQLIEELHRRLAQHRPGRLLVLCPQDETPLQSWVIDHPEFKLIRAHDMAALDRMVGTDRVNITVVINLLEIMEKTSGTHLIARLRDLLTQTLYITYSPTRAVSTPWNKSDFIALGLTHAGSYQQGDETGELYEYDIVHYKKTPEWLSPKHWANPALWNRFRW